MNKRNHLPLVLPGLVIILISGLLIQSQIQSNQDSSPSNHQVGATKKQINERPARPSCPEELEARLKKKRPEAADELPRSVEALIALSTSPQKTVPTRWNRELRNSSINSLIRLSLPHGEVMEGLVTEHSYPDGDGFSTTVELSSPKGRLTYYDIGGQSGGGLFFNGKSAALALAAAPSGEILASESTVSMAFCSVADAVFPLDHEANGPFMNSNEADGGPVQAPANGEIQIFNSKPDARKVIYIDFDGEIVPAGAWGAEINAASPNFSDSKIESIWRNVAEDFEPWDVNVTTERAVFDAARVRDRAHCIQTPTEDASPGAGGVAFRPSFGSGRVCWSFNGGLRSSAQTISHEVGHMLSLRHDGGAVNPSYYSGHGSGATKWGPIMGAAFSAPIVQWSQGEYNGAVQGEDDILKIGNYLPTVTDDVGDVASASTSLAFPVNSDVVVAKGVISTRTDVDYYRIVVPAEANLLEIAATPHSGDANLDIKLVIYDSEGNIVESASPTSAVTAEIVVNLNEGVYGIAIEGDGWGTPLVANPSGWTDYGSVGAYTLSMRGVEPISFAVELPKERLLQPGGNAEWFTVYEITNDGVDALRSGGIQNNQKSSFSITDVGSGTVSFFWRVSSEANYDFLSFIVDGVEIIKISGEQSYARVEHDLGEGLHTLEWAYTKDGSVLRGTDAGWVDQIVLGEAQWTGYEDYLAEYSAQLALPSDDLDGDGIANLIEYILSYNPTTANTMTMPFTLGSNGQGYFRLNTREDLSGLIYQVYGSDNLVDWELLAQGSNNSPLSSMTTGVTVNDLQTTSSDQPRELTVTENLPGKSRFYQFRANILDQ